MSVPTVSLEDRQHAFSVRAFEFNVIIGGTDRFRWRQIVQQLYSGHLPPDQQHGLQQQLFNFQKRPEAWTIIEHFLQHEVGAFRVSLVVECLIIDV